MVLTRALPVLAFAVAGCQPPAEGPTAEPDANEPFDPGVTSLAGIETVEDAIPGCGATTVVNGLSEELIAELDCIEPGLFESFEGVPGVTIGGAVFPFLQAEAVDALRAAASERDIVITSAYRTLPQQYLIYERFREGRCYDDAARPGNSNHQSGRALDVSNWEDARGTLEGEGFDWLGEGDPVHFDYSGDDLRSLSVLAFQRLWNQAHPDEAIDEDGVYGSIQTGPALARSPIRGFGLGTTCD